MLLNWFNVGLKMAVRWPFDFDIVFDIVTDQCYYGKEEYVKIYKILIVLRYYKKW